LQKHFGLPGKPFYLEVSRISEAKVLNFGKNFFGKVSNFGYNLCPKFWKDFDFDWKKPNNLDILDFRNNFCFLFKKSNIIIG